MNTNKAAEQNRNSKRQGSDLDLRYGKIGISAVAAAVRHQNERQAPAEIRAVRYEHDRD